MIMSSFAAVRGSSFMDESRRPVERGQSPPRAVLGHHCWALAAAGGAIAAAIDAGSFLASLGRTAHRRDGHERRTKVMRIGKPAATGFTLVEMLVVLVIVGMIAAMLFSSYQRILDVRIRLTAFLDGTDAPTLIASWFRGSVEGMLPEQKDGADVFAGTKRRLVGLSAAPIDGMPGVPTRIAWELAFDTASARTTLTYRSGTAAPLTVASWPGDRGGLRYCGPRLDCADSWPPPGGMSGETPSQLPALIILQAVRGTTDWPIAAAPQSARDPLRKPPNFVRPSS
jgi:prepilin-type N-terminal cleavage/methylation domain-containing protein